MQQTKTKHVAGAIVGVRPPLGGHVLQRASAGDGFKNHVLVPNVGQMNSAWVK